MNKTFRNKSGGKMANENISEKEWDNLLGEVSKKQTGMMVSFEVTDDNGNIISKVENRPFHTIGISLMAKDNPIVQFSVRDLNTNDMVSHFIDKVKSINVERLESGFVKGLQIKSSLGREARFTFQTA